eukprot:6988-Prymnesium_polylepis.1
MRRRAPSAGRHGGWHVSRGRRPGACVNSAGGGAVRVTCAWPCACGHAHVHVHAHVCACACACTCNMHMCMCMWGGLTAGCRIYADGDRVAWRVRWGEGLALWRCARERDGGWGEGLALWRCARERDRGWGEGLA